MRSKDLANAMIFAYLNSVSAHDEATPDQLPEVAAVALIRELADYMEGTDLGDALERTLESWSVSPVANVTPIAEGHNALSPADIEVTINGPHTPHNIELAMRLLALELDDLAGPNAVDEAVNVIMQAKNERAA